MLPETRRKFRRKLNGKMGMIHTEDTRKTLAELAAESGEKYDTIWRKAKREFPSVAWNKQTEVPADIAAALVEKKSGKTGKTGNRNSRPARTPKQQPATVNPTPAPADEPAPMPPGRAKKIWVLYLLLIAPTVASVHNMYIVTRDLSGNVWDAVALTVVLSVSALGFVWYGVRAWYTIALAGLLIAYEAFCNLTRIYGGLMGVGQSGNPTRFLGLVTDIFGSGSHCTGIVLGGITAAFLAAVQYAAIFELNKTSKQ